MKKVLVSLVILLLIVIGFVAFSPAPTPLSVKLYYCNPELDTDSQGEILCSGQGLVGVDRTIDPGKDKIEGTLKLLLRGEMTGKEIAEGVTTEFPLAELELEKVKLEDGILTLSFADPLFRTSGGACRIGILLAQVEATAKQFPEVKEIRYDPADVFQP